MSAAAFIFGIPAKRIGEVSEEQAKDIARDAKRYVERARVRRRALEQLGGAL